MFALSIALFALALIVALFGFHGTAAAFVWAGGVIAAVVAMIAYWRRREPE